MGKQGKKNRLVWAVYSHVVCSNCRLLCLNPKTAVLKYWETTQMIFKVSPSWRYWAVGTEDLCNTVSPLRYFSDSIG